MQPLNDVRVLDLTNVIAGPLASYQLAMLGAEVIKVEVPGVGDLARKMGADPELGARGMGASFLASNSGKKSLTLNLKDARGKAVFLRLAQRADVVVENFRPGTMEKLGLSYPALHAVNPGIVYCAVSGFGNDGPLAQRPSYDQIIQGFCGLMSLTGDEETAPMRAGYVVCDTMAAMTAAFAIAAALFRRQKTGEGEMIDVSMLDTALSTMGAWVVSNYLNAGKVPVPMGNESHTSAPSGTFRARDGLLNIVINEQKQWEKLCEVLGRTDLLNDARFAARDARMANRRELRPILEEALQARTCAEWEALFTRAGVPAGPILSVPQIVQHAHVQSRSLLKEFADAPGVGRTIRVPTAGYRLAHAAADVSRPPPVLGQDTDDILREAGYSDAEIEALRAGGVI
ncbi:MAG: CaiB/BaiF CoA transferase family protein [Burkholderiales bacterium]